MTAGSTNTAQDILAIDGLRLHFGGVAALDGVDARVPAGQITGLIGPNGAGKTTLFNTVSGFLRPSHGQVRFLGQDITGLPSHRVARAGLARTFQITRTLASLSVLENLMLYAPRQPGEGLFNSLAGLRSGRQRERVVLEQARAMAARLALTPVADQLAGQLSGGQRKLLEFGRVLMARPKLVLLDEPAAGVNPTLALQLAHYIREARDEGLTFLVIEHNMSLISQLCDSVIVMSQGKCLVQGSFAQVREDPRVQSAYMGKRAA